MLQNLLARENLWIFVHSRTMVTQFLREEAIWILVNLLRTKDSHRISSPVNTSYSNLHPEDVFDFFHFLI